MIHLNELPPCMLMKVFSYLPISEVIRLKLVCKAWRNTSTFVRFKSLSIYRHYGYEEQSFTKPERLLENYDLYINDFEKFFRSTGSMVSGVQHLVVCLYNHPVNYENNRLENFLNRFQLLEDLQLNVLPITSFDRFPVPIPQTFTLKLNRLRKLHLDCRWTRWARELTIELNCPKLSYLDVEKVENCLISHPEKLRTLVLKEASNRTDFSPFVNLKNLIINYGCDINWLTRAFVAGLPESLRKLIFFTSACFRDYYSNSQDFEDHLRKSYAIDREDSRLRIFFQGIEVSSNQFPINERERLRVDFGFIVANLADSIDANPCLNNLIDYHTIERHLPTFDLFFEKMHPDYRFSSITIYGNVADEDRLFEFLKRMRSCYLELDHIFPRPFFERLAEIKLDELFFNASDLGSEPGALDFLLRMNGLESVTVQHCPLALTDCLDFMITAFERIRSLDCFDFDWMLSFSFTFSLTDSSLNLWYIDEAGSRQNMYKSCKIEKYGPKNELDVLKYLNARLKQNSRLRAPNVKPNQLRDRLELLFLVDELKRQTQPGSSEIKAIKNYTKAIPIYL